MIDSSSNLPPEQQQDNSRVKVLLSLVILVVLAVALVSIPPVRGFILRAQQASPVAQTAIVLFFALTSAYALFGRFGQSLRQAHAQRQQEIRLKQCADDYDARIAALQSQHDAQFAQAAQQHQAQVASMQQALDDLKARRSDLEIERDNAVQQGNNRAEQADLLRRQELAEQLRAHNEALAQWQSRLEDCERAWNARLETAHTEWSARLQEAQEKSQKLEKQWETIVEQEANQIVWRRPDITNANAFLPLPQRKTVFVAMMNLKGGVGKTTLSANLAACWAQMPNPLRVLVVDTDFQGTLGNMCVDPAALEAQWHQRRTTARLLDPATTFDTIDELAVPMTNIENARVIFARDDLETADFRVQSRYMLGAQAEARFDYQRIFHQPQIRDKFDVVVFDCPPRLTASSINALACCDHIIIPTKLDYMSVSCMPRTIEWIHQLQGVIRAKPLAVVANETHFVAGKLIANQGKSYADLVGILGKRFRHPETLICRHNVKHSVQVVTTRLGVVASASATARKLFMPLAQELRDKMKL